MEQKVTREQFKEENDRSIKNWMAAETTVGKVEGKEVEKVVVYPS